MYTSEQPLHSEAAARPRTISSPSPGVSHTRHAGVPCTPVPRKSMNLECTEKPVHKEFIFRNKYSPGSVQEQPWLQQGCFLILWVFRSCRLWVHFRGRTGGLFEEDVNDGPVHGGASTALLILSLEAPRPLPGQGRSQAHRLG